MKKIDLLKKISGAKVLLALKCFSTWQVFPLMSRWMDGTTSSSLYEARLGYEKFGGETHAYCVAFSKEEVKEVCRFSDKIIFNSVSQLERFFKIAKDIPVGLRVNPEISYSFFDLADPARKYSRLGVKNIKELKTVLNKISGLMFHFNCENDSYPAFDKMLGIIEKRYERILKKIKWVSLGGGIYFTKKNYPLEKFAERLKEFSKKFNIQVYLEPGEAAITNCAELVTTVLDIIERDNRKIAIVDASTEAHMLDLLVYRIPCKFNLSKKNRYKYQIAGRSCLAGDVFGETKFSHKLSVGDKIKIADAGGYTMVKKNWFNGLTMPSIVIKKLSGKFEIVAQFNYNDFLEDL